MKSIATISIDTHTLQEAKKKYPNRNFSAKIEEFLRTDLGIHNTSTKKQLKELEKEKKRLLEKISTLDGVIAVRERLSPKKLSRKEKNWMKNHIPGARKKGATNSGLHAFFINEFRGGNPDYDLKEFLDLVNEVIGVDEK